MDVYEITGLATGVDKSGVNYLQPADSYQNLIDCFVYRQVLQSRQGYALFAPRLGGLTPTRIYGIFDFIKPDGTTELLAADANYLYKFDIGTAAFVQIPFGISLPAYPGFGLTQKEDYISGTSYPTATNTQRFVFTGKGMNRVFQYDGTTVEDYTNLGANPNYQAPALGTLINAHFVYWFGERLNFVRPLISGTDYAQGMLYSGIRNTAGNGDKFNVAGSGMIQLDTFETIVGASILGPYLAFNLTRSNWIIEKTRDAFNPYFSRKVAGVLGTNAGFSAVSYGDMVKSWGKTGIIGTDTRQSLRVDNKIPLFTEDEVVSSKFAQTYGGFDRTNDQFLWAYVSGSTSTTQDKVLVQNYEFDTWSVFDMRFSCFGQTEIGENYSWDEIDETIYASWGRWDTTEDIWNKIGIGDTIQKTLAGDDNGYIYQINTDFDDLSALITGIAPQPGAETLVACGRTPFAIGDKVVIENAQGMTEINNFDPETDPTEFVPYTVIATTATNITIDVDSNLFTPHVINTGTITKIISAVAETIPFNPYRSIGRRCFISHVEFLLDTNGGFLRVDVFADEEQTPFIQNVLISPTGIQKGREWISMSVDNEANFMTFRMRQESPATQFKLTSMRIHCKPGGKTSY